MTHLSSYTFYFLQEKENFLIVHLFTNMNQAAGHVVLLMSLMLLTIWLVASEGETII